MATTTAINGNETTRGSRSALGHGAVHVYMRGGDGRLSRQAYLKVPDQKGRLGSDLALSPDGNRLIAGAAYSRGETIQFGSALGGTEYGFGAGRIYQFDRDASGQWQLSQSLAIADGRFTDNVGSSVAMSDDTRWVVAGAPGRDYGDVTTPADFQSPIESSGAVYLFRRSPAGTLVQHLRLRPPAAPVVGEHFGSAVAMSGDGQWIAIGAPEDSKNTEHQAVTDPIAAETRHSGAVHVYRLNADGSVVRFASLKAPATKNYHRFGRALALSADGSRLAVGADLSGYSVETEPVYALGSSDIGSGDVFVYRRTDNGWTLEISLSGPRAEIFDRFFGYAVDLSADGRTLAVGMPLDGTAVGSANSGYVTWSGTVRTYELGAGGWAASGTMRSSPVARTTRLGKAVALSRDGRTVAAGAPEEETAGAGIDAAVTGDEVESGGVYLFRR